MNTNKAVVIFSGGQDSTTCLGVALQKHEEVHCISFRYAQKHSIELIKAREICRKLDVKHHIVDIRFLKDLVTSALVSDGDVNEAHPDNSNLPASFVPNRNALFITLAHAYAQKIGAQYVYTGVCQTDYSGYPDCRDSFITDITYALNAGSDVSLTTVTPLMWLTKAETFALAEKVGILDVVIELSHTCYNNDRKTENEWGYGCGECPACKLRAKGWEEYKRSKDLNEDKQGTDDE